MDNNFAQDLVEVRNIMATNLTNQNVTVIPDDGIRTLANKIASIESCKVPLSLALDGSFVSTSTSGDDTLYNILLKCIVQDVAGHTCEGVTIKFYDEDDVYLGYGVSDSTGLASCSVSVVNNEGGSLEYSFSVVHEGNSTYQKKVSSTEIKLLNYIYYDDCTVDNSSNYINYILLENGNAHTISYDSTNQAYKITAYTGTKIITIPELIGLTDYTFELDIMTNSTYGAIGVGYVTGEKTGKNYLLGKNDNGSGNFTYTKGSWQGVQDKTTWSVQFNTWYHVKVTVRSGEYSVEISDENQTVTYATYFTSVNWANIGIGVSATTSNAYFKNIKATSL